MNPQTHTKKEILEGVFDRAAEGYGRIRYFVPLGQQLAQRADIPRGAQVLDVAAGRGAILFPAVEAVGAEGRVIGIDLSKGMVDETNAEIRKRGLHNATMMQMDAETLEFPDASFDCVLCGFSLPFFPHLQKALSEFQRVLKPRGRVAVTTWGEEDSRWSWYDELCNVYQAVVPLRSQSLDTRDELLKWFRDAGFSNITVTTRDLDMIYTDEQEWWAMRWNISGRAGLERLAPNVLEKFKAEAFANIQPMKQPDGLHDLLQAHFTVATKV